MKLLLLVFILRFSVKGCLADMDQLKTGYTPRSTSIFQLLQGHMMTGKPIHIPHWHSASKFPILNQHVAMET